MNGLTMEVWKVLGGNVVGCLIRFSTRWKGEKCQMSGGKAISCQYRKIKKMYRIAWIIEISNWYNENVEESNRENDKRRELCQKISLDLSKEAHNENNILCKTINRKV